MIYIKLKFDRICVQMQSVLVLASSFRRADASHLHLLHSRTMMNHPRSSKIIQDHPSIFTTGGSWSWSCSLPVSASIQSSNAKEQSNSRCGIGLQICTFPSRPPHAYRRACDACGPQLSQQDVQSPAFVPAPLTSCNCKSRCGSHRSHLMFPHLFIALTLDHAFQESLHTGYIIYIYICHDSSSRCKVSCDAHFCTTIAQSGERESGQQELHRYARRGSPCCRS